jgi:hypothetical protein
MLCLVLVTPFVAKKRRRGTGFSLSDDALFELELRTALIAGKALSPCGADDEFNFVLTALPCNRVAAQFTEIALKDFHGDIPRLLPFNEYQ